MSTDINIMSTDMKASTDMKVSTDTKCLRTRNFMKLLLGPGIRLHLKWAEPIQEAELLLSKEKKGFNCGRGGLVV